VLRHIELESFLTTPFVPLVSKALTHHTLFMGGLTTYQQMLCLRESSLTSAASEGGSAAGARTLVSEPRAGGTHVQRTVSPNLNLGTCICGVFWRRWKRSCNRLLKVEEGRCRILGGKMLEPRAARPKSPLRNPTCPRLPHHSPQTYSHRFLSISSNADYLLYSVAFAQHGVRT
jgi:hypothetical protein